MTMDELSRLKLELSEIKTDFIRRTKVLERKIEYYERGQNWVPVAGTPALSGPPPQPGSVNQVHKAVKESAPAKIGARQDRSAAGTESACAARQKEKPDRKETFRTLAEGLIDNSFPIFGPAILLLGKLLSVYRHYKAQGKAPVFFMTVAGILTLVMGVGYLLQYSFSQFLGPLGKMESDFWLQPP